MRSMEHTEVGNHFFLGLLVGVLVLAFFVFLPFLAAIVLSATFAIVFTPLYKKIAHYLGGRKSIAAFLTVIIVVLVVLTPLVLLGFRLLGEATSVYAQLSSPEATTNAVNAFNESTQKIGEALGLDIAVIDFDQYIKRALAWVVQNFGSIFSGIVNAVFFFFLSLFGLYYFLRDGEKFRHALSGLMPLSKKHTEAIFNKLHITVNSVMKGTLAVAVIQGVLAGIGFTIFGVPSPIFWGALTVLGSLIPMFGTAFTVVPAVIYLLATGHQLAALGLLLWGMGLVGTIDNILRPYLLERSVNIHPFLILLSVLGGLELFGAIGFLLGPLVLSLLFSLLEIYATTVLKKEDVPEIA